jgi:hypothetical protein
VAFYTSDAFDAAAGGGAFKFNDDELNQVAEFLRGVNILQNIRSSNSYDARAIPG